VVLLGRVIDPLDEVSVFVNFKVVIGAITVFPETLVDLLTPSGNDEVESGVLEVL